MPWVLLLDHSQITICWMKYSQFYPGWNIIDFYLGNVHMWIQWCFLVILFNLLIPIWITDFNMFKSESTKQYFPLTSGVQQGSNLGPLSSIFFIIDIVNKLMYFFVIFCGSYQVVCWDSSNSLDKAATQSWCNKQLV